MVFWFSTTKMENCGIRATSRMGSKKVLGFGTLTTEPLKKTSQEPIKTE